MIVGMLVFMLNLPFVCGDESDLKARRSDPEQYSHFKFTVYWSISALPVTERSQTKLKGS